MITSFFPCLYTTETRSYIINMIIEFKILLLLVVAVESQLKPAPPVIIQNRHISSSSFADYFMKIFCTNCPLQPTCIQNLKNVQKLPETGNFNINQINNNSYNISQAIIKMDSITVSCTFPNRYLNNQKLDYVIFIPKSQQISGVIINYHPTLFGTSYTATSVTNQINAIAGLYVTSGYAVTFVNYLGQQYKQQFPHPYLQYPQCHVQCSIQVLNRALTKLKEYYPNVRKFKLFAVGYSQGASYALRLQKCLENPQICQNVKLESDYQYKAAAGLSGPYDLQHILHSFLTNQIKKSPQKSNTYQIQSQINTNYGKPSLLTSTLISYIYYSQGNENYEKIMNDQFWNMKCTRNKDQPMCEVNGTQFSNILEAIKSQKHPISIANSIAHSAFDKSFNTSKVKYLVPTRYMDSQTNICADKYLINSHAFIQTIRNASAILNAPKSNVFLFSLNRDSYVSVNNTLNYAKAYENSNKVQSYYFQNSQYKVCSKNSTDSVDADHNNAELLANLFALSFVKNMTLL